jgi:hypothetical protein
MILSHAEYERLVWEGTEVMDDINDTTEVLNGEKPFYVVGDPTS